MGHRREDVVAVALRVLDAHGLEHCSMRRIAAALDVQPSALYHHVPDKQTLLALMADEIVGDVSGDSGSDVTRSEPSVEDLCRDLRRSMLAVRDGADVVATASAYRLGASAVEARLADLVRARVGTERPDASRAASEGARTLLYFVFGHTQSTQMQLQAHEFRALAAGRPGDAAADPPGTSRRDLDASFDRGIATLIVGLTSREAEYRDDATVARIGLASTAPSVGRAKWAIHSGLEGPKPSEKVKPVGSAGLDEPTGGMNRH